MASSLPFRDFSTNPEAVRELKEALNVLCYTKQGCLMSLSIKQCNAISKYGSGGIPFSKAFVEVKEHWGPGDDIYLFGLIFEEYVTKLRAYLEKPDIEPTDERTKLVFSKLLNYILDKDHQNVLQSVINQHDFEECDVAVILAEHLFSKLSVSHHYTVDRQYPHSKSVKFCGCGCNAKIRHRYGDTSIGNKDVWHGNIDIIVGSLPVAVDEEVPDSEGGSSSLEDERCDSLENPDLTNQIIAQTIVYSFLQKKRHPELSNFLIPSIGVSRKGIIFYFYDSEKDVLLKSPSFLFRENYKEVSTVSILATWFVVNYKFLCSGLKLKYFKNVRKANFHELVDGALPILQDELSMGDIRSNKTVVEFRPGISTKCSLIGYDETEETEDVSPCKKLKSTQ